MIQGAPTLGPSRVGFGAGEFAEPGRPDSVAAAHKPQEVDVMNYPTAIVVSAGLIAGALLTSQGHSQPAGARYAIAGDGAAGVWLLDVAAGTVWACKRDANNVVCTPARTVKP
jgi:hypothetical protein